MRRISKIIVSLSLLFGMAAPFLVSSVTLADPFSGGQTQACDGVSLGGSGVCGTGASTLTRILGDVINLLSIAVGIAAVIMIIVGGLRYITSGGDSNNTSGAKNTILYAIVGLVVAMLAQVLVRFVIFKTSL